MKKDAAIDGRTPMLNGFDRVYIDAREFPQVRKFISIPRRTIYINTKAHADAKVIKLSFDDRDLFKV